MQCSNRSRRCCNGSLSGVWFVFYFILFLSKLVCQCVKILHVNWWTYAPKEHMHPGLQYTYCSNLVSNIKISSFLILIFDNRNKRMEKKKPSFTNLLPFCSALPQYTIWWGKLEWNLKYDGSSSFPYYLRVFLRKETWYPQVSSSPPIFKNLNPLIYGRYQVPNPIGISFIFKKRKIFCGINHGTSCALPFLHFRSLSFVLKP